MLELGIVVALALAIWLAVAKPVNLKGFVAKAGNAADEVTAGIKDSNKKMLGKVVRLGLVFLAVIFILLYSWETTALGKRLVTFLGSENGDLFDTLVKGPMLLLIALLLYKLWGGDGKSKGLNISWTAILSWLVVIGTIAFAVSYVSLKISDRNSATPYVQVSLLNVRLKTNVEQGQPVIVEMGTQVTAIVHIPATRYPNVVEACPKVVKPEKLLEDVLFKIVSGDGTSENQIRLTDESQQMLLKYGITKITVSFTGVLRPMADKTHCVNMIN